MSRSCYASGLSPSLRGAILQKTSILQPLEVKEVNELNEAVAQHHIHLTIIRQFMLVILKTDQTLSHLEVSQLLVVMTKYDLYVNIQASDLGDKLFMERCVRGPRTRHHMAVG